MVPGTGRISCGICTLGPELRLIIVKAYYLVHFSAEGTLASTRELVRSPSFSISRNGSSKMRIPSLQAMLWLPTAEEGTLGGVSCHAGHFPGTPGDSFVYSLCSQNCSWVSKFWNGTPGWGRRCSGLSPRGWQGPSASLCLCWFRRGLVQLSFYVPGKQVGPDQRLQNVYHGSNLGHWIRFSFFRLYSVLKSI